MRDLAYISLFSGIESASVAYERLGFKAMAFAEVDQFCNAVLAYHYPQVPNLGDVTKVDWSVYHGAADIVVGGSPCQEFSIAGPKDGLGGERGRLMLEFLRACEKIGPEWVVIENVPNLLSIHGGKDFQAILETMVGMWPRGGIAWRVLDAAFFSLPQRRRRLFVVVSTRDPDGAAEVLLDGEGDNGPAAEGGPGWEELARGAGIDIEAEGWCLASAQAHAELTRGISPTLTTLHEAPIWVRPDGTVRRLTPDEYEVLQGFERGWTDIPWKGRRAPDSLRYRAVGNSFPVPILRFIGERIVKYEGGRLGQQQEACF